MEIEELLLVALTNETCPWEGDSVSDHTAEEYQGCLYATFFTKEGKSEKYS